MRNVFGLVVKAGGFGPLAGKNLLQNENLLPNESKVADIIGTALEELRSGAMGQSMMNALQAGNAQQAIANLDWGRFGQTLSTMRLPLEQQLVTSGQGEAKALGDVVGNMAFNVTDPRAVEWAATRAGELVVTTSQAVRDDVRGVITQAFIEQTNPREIAGMIDRQVGLFPRWANAVENRYQSSLSSFVAGGMSIADAQDRAQALADAYRERLIDKRCQMIARTEVIRAANEGRATAWAQAADAGLIDRATTTKEWIAEADACEDCAELDAEQVWMDDEFSNGEEMPPLHPNCRCSAVLVPDGEPTEKEPAEVETPEVDTLPAMTSEDITPTEETSDAITDIQNAIAEIPDWTEDMISYETPGGEPSELMVQAEEQVRAVGDSIATEIDRRLDERGVGVIATDEELEAARIASGEARSASADAMIEAMDKHAESLGMTTKEWLASTDYDINGARAIIHEANPELVALDRRATELENEWRVMKERADDPVSAQHAAYIETMQEVLAEIRPMGVPDDGISWATLPEGASPIDIVEAHRTQSVAALSNYPTAWIEASNARGEIYVADAASWFPDNGIRGLYSDAHRIVHIPGSRTNDTALYVHEWGHRMERSNERVQNLEWAFHSARSAGEKPQLLSDVTGIAAYGPTERTVVDSFSNPYMGKVYSNTPTSTWELLTMGMEGIMNNGFGVMQDRDYLNFILGTLATA